MQHYAHGKGAAAAAQVKRLMKVNGGIGRRLAKRLYEVVVLPNMLYVTDV